MTTLLRRLGTGAVAGAFALSGLVALTSAPAHAFDPACQPADPVLTSLKVSPTKVNVKTGQRTVVVSGTTSGPALDYVTIYGDPVGKGTDRSAWVENPKSNSFSAKVVVPKGAANGKHLLTVSLSTGDSYESYSPEQLQTLGMPNSFNVISKPDLKAPVLKKVKLSSKKVNTTKKVAKVKVTVTAKDAGGSGLEGAWIGIGRGSNDFAFAVLKRKKKQLVGTVTVPKWVGSGKATVLYASVSDVAGNATSYGLGTGAKKLKPAMKPKLKITSKKDSAKPAVASVSATPGSMKVGDRRWQVSYSVKVSDKQSGVASVQTALRPQGDANGWESAWASLTPGKNGTWTGKGVVECYDQAGTYDILVVARDRAGNELSTTRGTVTLTR